MPLRSATLLLLLLPTGCVKGQVHEHFNVRTDGAVLPVEVHGNIDSGTLLVVESGGPSGPGIAERAVGYHPFQDTLEPQVAVAWYDRRGTGNAEGDYEVADQSMGQLIDDLDAVLTVLEDRYQPERLVLLGHSFGTYSSALYQLEHPGRIDGWVAAAPAIIESPDELYIPYRRAFACRIADGQVEEGQQDALWTDIQAFCLANPTLPLEWDTPERAELWEYLGEIEDRLEPWPAMDVGGLLGAVVASHYNLIDTMVRSNRISSRIEPEPGREDLLPELAGLTVPVAVITGEYDGTTPTELGDALCQALPGPASCTEIAEGGHYMMTDDPQGFAQPALELVDAL